MFAGYRYNERAMLSPGVVDPQIETETEVELIWGEPDGRTAEVPVEFHKQLTIRAMVNPAPYTREV